MAIIVGSTVITKDTIYASGVHPTTGSLYKNALIPGKTKGRVVTINGDKLNATFDIGSTHNQGIFEINASDVEEVI